MTSLERMRKKLRLPRLGSGPHWFALLGPCGSFYRYVLQCLEAGFAERGYACVTVAGELARDRLAAWADRYRPTAVLEINRVLGAGEPWPRGCPHLAWIRDYRFEGQDLTRSLNGVSDHLYFIMYPEQFGLARLASRSWSILLPAARAGPPEPLPASYDCDFAFCGFMPSPVDPAATVSFRPDQSPVSLGEFLQRLPPHALGQWQLSFPSLREALSETCRKLACAEIESENILQVFDHILPRTLDRLRLVEAALSVSGSLRIYGPPNWLAWPSLATYWRGFVEDPAQLDAIYRSARVNLHNSITAFHSRVVDCIAAGGFIMVHPTRHDFQLGGIRNYLEPDRHYGIYEMNNSAAAARRYLEDETLRRKITAEGRRVVLAAHTWSHRAGQILRDLGLPADARRKGEANSMQIREAAATLAALVEGGTTLRSQPPGESPASP